MDLCKVVLGSAVLLLLGWGVSVRRFLGSAGLASCLISSAGSVCQAGSCHQLKHRCLARSTSHRLHGGGLHLSSRCPIVHGLSVTWSSQSESAQLFCPPSIRFPLVWPTPGLYFGLGPSPCPVCTYPGTRVPSGTVAPLALGAGFGLHVLVVQLFRASFGHVRQQGVWGTSSSGGYRKSPAQVRCCPTGFYTHLLERYLCKAEVSQSSGLPLMEN